jgi:DNA replication protein DnaC
MNSDKKALKESVSIGMRKMMFSAPTVHEYVEKASLCELTSINKLLSCEQELRTVSRRARLIKSAGFPTLKSFDGYDFTGIQFPNLLDKEHMLSLDFIRQKKTLVFYGGCGSGKTHAMTALGMAACGRDYKVRFYTLSALVMMLKNARMMNTLERMYRMLSCADLLCLDEFGYLPLDIESGQLLFNVISNAYEKQALIITTNLPFNDWGPLFADDQLAAAVIDRIVHYGHLIKTGNKDWRLEHSLMIDK